MEAATAKIPARSHRQAMDWSLVLVSQGIESIIDDSGDAGGWGLIVATQDYENALNAIRLYQHENRRWPWRQELFRPGFLFDWASLAWAFLVCLFFWLQATATRLDLDSAGRMDSIAVAHGQWWRLFTAVWLHADIAHLAANATIGFVLLGLTMGLYGTGAGLLAAYLAGAGGNLAVWLLASDLHLSLGASGMVMGSLGLLAVQSFSLRRQTPHAAKYILSGVLGGLMLFILLGLSPGSDLLAHLGGFLTGLLLGAGFALVPNIAQKPKINFLSGLLFVLLVIIPWWLAIRSMTR
jgi:membrane associated rhomboid family serine protease